MISGLGSIQNLLQQGATSHVAPQKNATPAAQHAPEDALTNVLTAEEKQFFEQMSSMGPLSYGGRPAQQVQQPTAGQPLGRRLDVRG